jgi:hypothetical protein
MTEHTLPDGRTVVAERMPEGKSWYLRIEDVPRAEIVGWPLNSTLADLLGYFVGRERWPSWVDDFARDIESANPA